MGLILLTLLIALVNLCLGYALAVRLGYGPPSLIDAWEILLADHPQSRAIADPVPPTEENAAQPTPPSFSAQAGQSAAEGAEA